MVRVWGSGQPSSGPPSLTGPWERGVGTVEQDELSRHCTKNIARIIGSDVEIPMTEMLGGLILH